MALLVAAVAFFVLVPIGYLGVSSLQVGQLGQATHWGLDNWRLALSDPAILRSIGNTAALSAEREAIALVLAVPIAWLLARTNIPGRGWLEFSFWVAVFMPQLTVTLSWIMVFGDGGFANRALIALHLTNHSVFNIYSWWGIIFVHLMTTTLPIKVMLLTPAFRNLDASLELASLASGATRLRTLLRIVVPIMSPVILIVVVLGVIFSMQAFEIELILGYPAGIDVFSTKIYHLVSSTPPELGQATVLGLVILILLLPIIALQQWYSARHRDVLSARRWNSSLVELGGTRWLAFGALAALAFAMTVAPVCLVVMGTFMKLFGIFTKSTWTAANWRLVLSDSTFGSALSNTLLIGLCTAAVCMLVLSLIAYVTVRARSRLRHPLDFMIWLPSALPGIVIGLGYLWLVLATPVLRPAYGSWIVLALVLILSNMALTTQVMKGNLQQLGQELEEASFASGGSWLYTFRRIVFPLIAPTVGAVGILAFSAASKATSQVALLSSATNQPLAMLQLGYMAQEQLEQAAVVGVFVLTLTVGLALVTRVVFKVRTA